MLLRRMQGFRLNIHAAPGCSPSPWHLEAQAEELRDVVACATPAVDLHTYSVRTPQVPITGCDWHNLHHNHQVQTKCSNSPLQ